MRQFFVIFFIAFLPAQGFCCFCDCKTNPMNGGDCSDMTSNSVGADTSKKDFVVKIWVVELSKSKGTGACNCAQACGQADSSSKALTTGAVSNLIPKLNWAKSHGFARILKEKELAGKGKLKIDLAEFKEGVTTNIQEKLSNLEILVQIQKNGSCYILNSKNNDDRQRFFIKGGQSLASRLFETTSSDFILFSSATSAP